MNAVRQEDLAAAFEALAGFPPMRWQTRLYGDRFARGRVPAALDLPTGLGKTAVMTLWLIARARGTVLPRRKHRYWRPGNFEGQDLL